jgi:hypothetical protein
MNASKWFYSANGQAIGPVTFDQLRQLGADGRLAHADLVWAEGTPDWVAAGTVAGLLPPAHAQVPTPPPPDIRQPYAQSAVEYYGNRPNHAGQSHNGMAIAGFVLSLVLPLFGLIFSLIALNGMKTSGNPEGKGLATAGLVISIVLLSLVCLYFIGLATCFGAFASR